MFMGDAKSIVDVVNSDEQDWSRKGHITNGIRANVHTFEHWTFTHTSREANQVAHELVKLATKLSKDAVWFLIYHCNKNTPGI
jgi:hypothetical protein